MATGGGGGSDDFHGLTFGQKIYFEQDAGAAGGSATGGRKGKGAAASASAAQPPRCRVDGCGVDLSAVKQYYCRHKVCYMHSKEPRVFVAGIEQRFCQQCSRFKIPNHSFRSRLPVVQYQALLLSSATTTIFRS
jgi:hypothetical protein